MDGVLGFLLGLFLGGLLGFFVAALIIANGREVETETDGVDDVLDELFKAVQNQPKTVHDEEEKKDIDWKFRERGRYDIRRGYRPRKE